MTENSSNSIPTAGDYPFGRADLIAGWDGDAWTGATQEAPGIEVPVWKHAFLPFLRHRWFWLFVLGLVLVLIPAFACAASGSAFQGSYALPGAILMMVAGARLVLDRMSPEEIGAPRAIVLWGIFSGAVGYAFAYGVESLVAPALSDQVYLWTPGPIEETGKLLVPVLLLAFGPAAFRSPRVGLWLVLVSGATFGVFEMVSYAANSQGNGAIASLMERSTTELLHPYLTGFAAVLIWLGAWRGKKTLTIVGFVGWLIASAVHSFHDGIFGVISNPAQTNTQGYSSAGEAFVFGLYGLAEGLLITVLLFLLLRHVAREIVSPTAIASNSPHWRPQLKRWGLPKVSGS